jgi:hypothetical protein
MLIITNLSDFRPQWQSQQLEGLTFLLNDFVYDGIITLVSLLVSSHLSQVNNLWQNNLYLMLYNGQMMFWIIFMSKDFVSTYDKSITIGYLEFVSPWKDKWYALLHYRRYNLVSWS